ncbi:SAM-dependent methyltransferase [Legionella tunisiensis]|uniref:SAM-dependent methyltransferase n=1 Tax=Legionella tunisiensis TaxID=1034944 RepID=UPI0009FF9AB6
MKSKSKRCQSLCDLYHSTDERANAYIKISDHVLESFKIFNNVCVVVYGHPLLLSNSIDHLISQACTAHISLTITPAISSFDCLLADLKIDPFWGCISIEANALIKEDKHIDNTYHLIIWQIGIINDNKSSEKMTLIH